MRCHVAIGILPSPSVVQSRTMIRSLQVDILTFPLRPWAWGLVSCGEERRAHGSAISMPSSSVPIPQLGDGNIFPPHTWSWSQPSFDQVTLRTPEVVCGRQGPEAWDKTPTDWLPFHWVPDRNLLSRLGFRVRDFLLWFLRWRTTVQASHHAHRENCD